MMSNPLRPGPQVAPRLGVGLDEITIPMDKNATLKSTLLRLEEMISEVQVDLQKSKEVLASCKTEKDALE